MSLLRPLLPVTIKSPVTFFEPVPSQGLKLGSAELTCQTASSLQIHPLVLTLPTARLTDMSKRPSPAPFCPIPEMDSQRPFIPGRLLRQSSLYRGHWDSALPSWCLELLKEHLLLPGGGERLQQTRLRSEAQSRTSESLHLRQELAVLFTGKDEATLRSKSRSALVSVWRQSFDSLSCPWFCLVRQVFRSLCWEEDEWYQLNPLVFLFRMYNSNHRLMRWS